MNLIRSFLILAVISFSPLFAENAPANATTSAPVAQVATMPPQSKSDAVLDFILKKAEKYSGTLEEGIAQAVDFAKEQAPLAVKEWLTWRTYEAIWNIAFPFLVLAILGTCGHFCGKRMLKAIADSDMYRETKEVTTTFTWIIVRILPIGIPAIFTLVALCNNIPTIIQIQVAPRVYLIEEAMKLVHK
jgi:hypothetical protein